TSERAEKLLLDKCVGVQWELVNTRLFHVWSLFFLGELGELSHRVPVLLREAKERGDLYAATAQRIGLANVAWLAQGDPETARARIDEAAASWSHEGFHFQHYWSLLAEVNLLLYEGDGRGAHALVHERWPALARSLFLRIHNIRVEAVCFRARAALTSA